VGIKVAMVLVLCVNMAQQRRPVSYFWA